MGQRADRDKVHSRPGDFADRLQRHAAAGLGLGTAINQLDGFADLFAAHVVKQDDVRAGFRRRPGLLDRVCLNLNFQFGRRLACQRHCLGDVAIECGEMVVLDHHPVVKPNAVIRAAAAGHGVFLQRAPAGSRLSCVENLRPSASDLLDEPRRECGHAGQALDEIEGGSLRREQCSGRPLHAQQRLAKPTELAVENLDAKLDAFINLLKRSQGKINPGHDQRIAGDHHRHRERVPGHQGQGGRVAAADVLGQGGLDQRQVIVRLERFQHRQKSWPSEQRIEA